MIFVIHYKDSTDWDRETGSHVSYGSEEVEAEDEASARATYTELLIKRGYNENIYGEFWSCGETRKISIIAKEG